MAASAGHGECMELQEDLQLKALVADWDFNMGRRFEASIVSRFRSPVHHPSSSSSGAFHLLVIFRRFTFRLTEGSVSLALHAALGGTPAGFHVTYLKDRHFRFSVASKSVGFVIRDLKRITTQVLHPQSMRPAREGDIPVRVKNSYNPKAPGTLITKKREMDKVVLTSIVLKSNVTMLDIVSTRMLGQFGFLARVFSIFEDLGISVDCVATSEVSVSVSLDPSKIWSRELIQQELDNVVEELEKIAVVHLLQKRAIISLIGNVRRSSLILEKAFHVLRKNGVNVQMISQGASKVNMSLIVHDSEARACIKALHQAFFEDDEVEPENLVAS